tara:strand:+ start:868 stop:1059 length:192 start_codon:yes stop_codon:yes gene_type:complete
MNYLLPFNEKLFIVLFEILIINTFMESTPPVRDIQKKYFLMNSKYNLSQYHSFVVKKVNSFAN